MARPAICSVSASVSATGADVHVEGSAAPTEEVLEWGSVELKAENIKKWITVSDEALEGTTVDTLGELYKEIAQRIVEKAEEIAIGKIVASPAASTATAPGVPVYKAPAIAADVIVMAEALLSGKARNLYVAMNRQTYAAFISVALAANYAIDVFDGLKDKVIFTDKLPAFGTASVGAVPSHSSSSLYQSFSIVPSSSVYPPTTDLFLSNATSVSGSNSKIDFGKPIPLL